MAVETNQSGPSRDDQLTSNRSRQRHFCILQCQGSAVQGSLYCGTIIAQDVHVDPDSKGKILLCGQQTRESLFGKCFRGPLSPGQTSVFEALQCNESGMTLQYLLRPRAINRVHLASLQSPHRCPSVSLLASIRVPQRFTFSMTGKVSLQWYKLHRSANGLTSLASHSASSNQC